MTGPSSPPRPFLPIPSLASPMPPPLPHPLSPHPPPHLTPKTSPLRPVYNLGKCWEKCLKSDTPLVWRGGETGPRASFLPSCLALMPRYCPHFSIYSISFLVWLYINLLVKLIWRYICCLRLIIYICLCRVHFALYFFGGGVRFYINFLVTLILRYICYLCLIIYIVHICLSVGWLRYSSSFLFISVFIYIFILFLIFFPSLGHKCLLFTFLFFLPCLLH